MHVQEVSGRAGADAVLTAETPHARFGLDGR
jgi:hypothetical protein